MIALVLNNFEFDLKLFLFWGPPLSLSLQLVWINNESEFLDCQVEKAAKVKMMKLKQQNSWPDHIQNLIYYYYLPISTGIYVNQMSLKTA